MYKVRVHNITSSIKKMLNNPEMKLWLRNSYDKTMFCGTDRRFCFAIPVENVMVTDVRRVKFNAVENISKYEKYLLLEEVSEYYNLPDLSRVMPSGVIENTIIPINYYNKSEWMLAYEITQIIRDHEWRSEYVWNVDFLKFIIDLFGLRYITKTNPSDCLLHITDEHAHVMASIMSMNM